MQEAIEGSFDGILETLQLHRLATFTLQQFQAVVRDFVSGKVRTII